MLKITNRIVIGVRNCLKPVSSSRTARSIIRYRSDDASVQKHVTDSPASLDIHGERDLVNFPRPERAEFPGRVRLGFIPTEWFEFFYPRTGVTGPYAFAVGNATYLFSKEVWVLEHNFYGGISMAIICVYSIKTFGKNVAAYADTKIAMHENQFIEGRLNIIKEYEQAIIDEKREQENARGQMLLFEAKRLSIAYQIEAEYRERIYNAYQKVKARLEWEVEQERVIRNLSIKHMIRWIHKEVNQLAISESFDKRMIQQCIEELAAMAPYSKRASRASGYISKAAFKTKTSIVIPLLLQTASKTQSTKILGKAPRV